jgi:tRNA-2-methylthio-N6-dimethylallyladenosine synthase
VARRRHIWHNRVLQHAMSISRFTSADRAPEEPRAEVARKVHVVTFGCQMNKYDSLLAEGRFRREGFAITSELHEADIVLFNTCSVREHAEDRTWSWVGELKRAKEARPDLIVGVMGCMAQRVGDEIFDRAGHVDIVAGTRQFARLPALVEEVLHRRQQGLSRSAARVLALEMDDPVAIDRSDEPWDGGLHAYLTVMRGCDLNCTYCIVPRVRGRVISYPIAHLVREARGFVEKGVRVITLLGQTVNSYGEDFAPPAAGEPELRGRQGRASLADLLYELQAIPGLMRIRLITLHPSYVTNALAQAIAQCSKVERFLPLPAQSGSDRVLKAMKRGYNRELFAKRTEILRAAVPDIELASDWIVGFPTETDAEHEQSEALLAEQGFVVNYIFKYSPRPSTHAAEALADDVPEEVKKTRNQRLLALAAETGLKRHSRHVGETRRTFVEGTSEKRPGELLGRTIHGMIVSFPGPAECIGREIEVRIEGASPYGLAGSAAADPRALQVPQQVPQESPSAEQSAT